MHFKKIYIFTQSSQIRQTFGSTLSTACIDKNLSRTTNYALENLKSVQIMFQTSRKTCTGRSIQITSSQKRNLINLILLRTF